MVDDVRAALRKLANKSQMAHLQSASLFAGLERVVDDREASPEQLFIQGRFLLLAAERKSDNDPAPNIAEDLFNRAFGPYQQMLKRGAKDHIYNTGQIDMFHGAARLLTYIAFGRWALGEQSPENELCRAISAWLKRWKLYGKRYDVFALSALIQGTSWIGSEFTQSPLHGWRKAVADFLQWAEAANMCRENPDIHKSPAAVEAYFGINRNEYIEKRIEETQLLVNTGALSILEENYKIEVIERVRSAMIKYCDSVDATLKAAGYKRRSRPETSEFERDIRFVVDRVIHGVEWDVLIAQEEAATRKNNIGLKRETRLRHARLRVQKAVRDKLSLLNLPRRVAFPQSKTGHLPEVLEFELNLAAVVDQLKLSIAEKNRSDPHWVRKILERK
jgi:hypothetical protein